MTPVRASFPRIECAPVGARIYIVGDRVIECALCRHRPAVIVVKRLDAVLSAPGTDGATLSGTAQSLQIFRIADDDARFSFMSRIHGWPKCSPE